MTRDHVRFLVSGVLFGFLIGYIIAYAVHEPRVVQHAAPVPAAGNLGMSGGIGSLPAAPAAGGRGMPGGPGGDASAGAGNEQMMAQVFEEISALKAAIEKNPKDAAVLIRLANLYHDAAKYDQAVEYYGRALQVRPADVDARTDMGICLREMGKSDEAIAQFRTSLTHDPKHWQTWLNLGVVSLFDKKDVAAATQAIAKVEEINPSFKDLPLLKEALRKAGAPAGPDS